MKRTFNLTGYLILAFGLLVSSCVPSAKFTASESNATRLQKNNENVQTELNQCNSQVKTLTDQKTYLQTENSTLKNENTAIQSDMKDLTNESKLTISDQAKRLKKLQDIIQSQKDIMSKIKNSIADALMNYKTDELSVYVKNGNVYVSLEEKLLFKSGSDVVGKKGKEALKSLAKVLNNTKDVSVMIEGHTDNIPIKTKAYEDNWDLSTARATSVVRILTKDYGFDASRITASGRGKYHPVKTNETADGRAGNRRTVVSLSPDLKELYKLMDQ
jgi:chemotaxis protein MotB